MAMNTRLRLCQETKTSDFEKNSHDYKYMISLVEKIIKKEINVS